MRVVMLSWEYPPRIVGGISPHVYELSQKLQSKGIEVHVVTKATPNAPDEETEPSGVQVHGVHLDAKPNDFVHEIQILNRATDKRVRKLLEDWRPGGQHADPRARFKKRAAPGRDRERTPTRTPRRPSPSGTSQPAGPPRKASGRRFGNNRPPGGSKGRKR